MHPDAGAAPDGHQLVQAGPDILAVGTQMRNVRASRPGKRAGDVGHLLRAAEPARQVVQAAGQSDRPLRERALDLTPGGSSFAGAERATHQAGDVVPDRALGSEDGNVLRQAPRHRGPVADHAEVVCRVKDAVDRREVLVQVPSGGRRRADPRLPILADHERGHPLGELAVDPPGRQQRAFGMNVRIDEAGADYAARGQVDHLAADRSGPETDRGDDLAVDQDVCRDRRGADPIGYQAATEQHPRGQRLISHPSRPARPRRVGSRRRATPPGPRRRGSPAPAPPGPSHRARAAGIQKSTSGRADPCRARACPGNATGRGSVTNGGRGTSCGQVTRGREEGR
jgi:hypothetical protein